MRNFLTVFYFQVAGNHYKISKAIRFVIHSYFNKQGDASKLLFRPNYNAGDI